MTNNTDAVRSRKFQLTINNPQEHGFTHEVIRTTLDTLPGIRYWCMCDEVGQQGTPHTHLYIFSPNAISFETLHRRFYGAHIETARGSHQENRDYIRKEGKWALDEKRDTNLPDTFEENGPIPEERSKAATVSEEILDMIQSGATNAQIIREHPGAMNRIPHIEAARQALREEQYREQFRFLDVTYIWGKTGVGKTRGIMERHGYKNVYRISNYEHPFDGYQGQPVILFDEFRSSLPLGDMLNYLDGYPIMLPCRYADRVACYTSVYIVSNIPLKAQYPNVQQMEPESYQAFLRRIGNDFEMPDQAMDCPY